MASLVRTETDDRDLRIFWAVVAAATAALLLAAMSGLVLGIADPNEGSATDDFWNGTAAIAGLSCGALFGFAAIWAQLRNLWRFAPTWFRYLAWGVMLVVIVVGIASSTAR